MIAYGLFKLEGITTLANFNKLKDQKLLLQDVFIKEEGQSLSFDLISGFFDDNLSMFCVGFVVNQEGKTDDELEELLMNKGIKSYKASFGEFKNVKLIDFYSCEEETWEVTEYKIEEAVNLI